MRTSPGRTGHSGVGSARSESAGGGEEMKAPIPKPQTPEKLQAQSQKPGQVLFGNSQIAVPKGHLKIARRFNAGSPVAPRQVPKGRLKYDGRCVQSSLRDSNGIDSVPGVETPGYSGDVPPGHRASNFRTALEMGRACLAVWILRPGVYLELGAWDLELPAKG